MFIYSLAITVGWGLTHMDASAANPDDKTEKKSPLPKESNEKIPVYTGELIRGRFAAGTSHGPGAIAHGAISNNRIFSAKRNRLYFFDNGLESYDPETGLVEQVAGSGAAGDLDGPANVWRGRSWTYQEGGIGLDDEKGIIYVTSSNKIKAISLEDGSLRTVTDKIKVRSICFAGGFIYCTGWKSGLCRVHPETGNITRLSTEPFPGENRSAWGFMTVDLERNKAYGHSRGVVYQMDLKTGKFSILAGNGKIMWSASTFDQCKWWCPSGAQMSADNRFLLIGGGDHETYLRLDLDKKYREVMIRTGKGKEVRWTWGNPGKKTGRIFPWPSTLALDANTGYLYFGIKVWPAAARLKPIQQP